MSLNLTPYQTEEELRARARRALELLEKDYAEETAVWVGEWKRKWNTIQQEIP